MSKTTSADDGLAPSTAVASAGVAVASSSPQQGSTLQRDITAADGMVDAARRAYLEALLAEKEARLQRRLVEHQRLQADNAALEQECRELHAEAKAIAQRNANWLKRHTDKEARRSLLQSADVTAARDNADEEEARLIQGRTDTISTLEHDATTASAYARQAQAEAEENKATAQAYKAAAQSTALLVVGEAAKFCHRRVLELPEGDGAKVLCHTRRRYNAVAHPQLSLARVQEALEVLSKTEPDTASAMRRLLAAARAAFDTDEEFGTAMAAFRCV